MARMWLRVLYFLIAAGMGYGYACHVFDEWQARNVRDDEKRNFRRHSRSFARLFAVIVGLAVLYVAEIVSTRDLSHG